MPSYTDAALLLLGHGSTLNADSSAPTFQHAEELRSRGIFKEVHVGFWKEEPNFRQALRQTNCTRVYVVPNFISSGYFTEQVIPRELALYHPVTRQEDRGIIYCDPVGLHPSMTEALLHKAREVVASSGEKIAEPAKTACLFICGHGTSFNDNSTKIIREQAEAIRARGLYADCQPVLMEQAPFVKDWRELTSCPDVIVVPFFIADGLHSFEDIPVLLGLTHDIRKNEFHNPHREGTRRLWYASAIGTEKFIADVVMAQVAAAWRKYHTQFAGPGGTVSAPGCARINSLPRVLAWKIGQVVIRKGFELRHALDAEVADAELRLLRSFADLRELIRLDAQDQFRPLRAAPNLRSGWIYRAADFEDLSAALDYLYPAEVANWNLWRRESLPITGWGETAERQTGRFRVVKEIDTKQIAELVCRYCEPGCLKKRLWAPVCETIELKTDEVPLLCPEACNFLVGKAREKLKGPGDE